MSILTVNSDFEKLFGVTEREYYAKQYLTYEMLEDQDAIIYWTAEFINAENTNLMTQISFSIDDGKTWTDVEIDDREEYTIQNLKKGDRLLLKGNGGTYNYSSKQYVQICPNSWCRVYGNIMSLVYGDDFYGKNFDTAKLHSFGYLLAGIDDILDAHDLILPTNTVRRCYMHMFEGCDTITTAPELLSTNIAQQAYESMFSGCSKLAYVASPARGNINTGGTTNWLKNVAANGTFVSDFNANWNNGASGIPTGWTKKYYELPTPQQSITFNPPAGVYVGEVEPNIITTGKYSGIKYTVDGSDPITNGQEFTGQGDIHLDDTTTVKAVVYNTDGSVYLYGDVYTAVYALTIPTMYAYVDKFPPYKDEDDPDYDPDYDMDYPNKTGMTRSEYIAAEVADPEQYSSDKYYYIDETLEYEGNTYCLWHFDDYLKYGYEDLYMLTTTADYSTLAAQSIAESSEDTAFSAMYGNITIDSRGVNRYRINAEETVPYQLLKIENARNNN